MLTLNAIRRDLGVFQEALEMKSQQQRIQVKGELVAVYSVAQVPCADRGLTKLLETVQPLRLLSKQGISHLTVQNCRYSFAFSEKEK